MDPVIDFKGYSIKEISYKRIDDQSEIDVLKQSITDDDGLEKDFDRKIRIGTTEDLKSALLELEVSVYDLANRRTITCELSGQFNISDELTIEQINEVISISGVGILYPYLRSIISILTTLDSPNAIVIPTINPNYYNEE
ncbi:protein-export chaperone SecB [Exiguobacterium sp. JLM-2]|jgi:preprotein translocase subunit SecB|uniref:protein-export chaperone SecB n=1 Tax=Exiguobacterium sp. JLM-2 TaxID=1647415 RepID=UPI00064A4B58|nr:protein-export chaperone SecB [Exiguobacterium sp. JLM-2]